MKKIFIFVLPILLFVSIFMGLSLCSYALVTVEPEINGFSQGTYRYNWENYAGVHEEIVELSENSAYNRYGMCCYYISGTSTEQWQFFNVLDLLNGIDSNSEPFCYVVEKSHFVGSDDYTTTNWYMTSQANYGVNIPTAMFTTDFPVFASKQKAIDYYRYGLLDDTSIRYGAEYLNDSTFDDIVYDPLEVPAPNVEWVADSNGHFTHKLHFLNNGYFGEHNTQLNYGLILSMHWLSVNNGTISIYQNQGVYTRYQFTANDFCMSDEVRVYPNPQTPFNFNDYACPPYLDLDANGLCINGFNQMLSAYPVNSRNFVSSSNQSNANYVLNTIKGNLDDINYKLNCPIVSCQYFVIDDNNNLVKGPITKINIKYPNPCYFNDTGADLGYDDSEIQNWNPETDTPLNDPTVIAPPASPNPGPQSPIQIPDYSSVNAQDLVDNMQSIFGLVGQVPFFVTQLFNFLPDWLITFIAVSIGLVVAIGVIKLFLG